MRIAIIAAAVAFAAALSYSQTDTTPTGLPPSRPRPDATARARPGALPSVRPGATSVLPTGPMPTLPMPTSAPGVAPLAPGGADNPGTIH